VAARSRVSAATTRAGQEAVEAAAVELLQVNATRGPQPGRESPALELAGAE
jgi:hypothetical protein